MDVDGRGMIQHIWMATEKDWRGNGRASVLRFYWDGEDTPSVEVPIPDGRFIAFTNTGFAQVENERQGDVLLVDMARERKVIPDSSSQFTFP